MMFLETALRDVKLAFRQIGKAPVVSGAAILALALGIGSNTAIFTLFDVIVLRPLPVHDPSRLVLLGTTGPNGTREVFSYPAYQHLIANAGHTADLFAHSGLGTIDVSIDGKPETQVRDVVMISGNYFSALGVAPVAGRPILPRDAEPSAELVAVISHRFWENRFSGQGGAIGRTLSLNGTTFTIVGVAPSPFFGTSIGEMIDVWVPITAQPSVLSAPSGPPGRPTLLTDVNANWLTVFGRLAPGARREALTTVLDAALSRYLQQAFGGGPGAQDRPDLVQQRLQVHDGARGVSWVRKEFSGALMILMLVAGLVLMIACANVANLSLTVAVSRQREIAIRRAIGAGQGALVRQLLTESLVVASFGGALGILLGVWTAGGLLGMLSPGQAHAPVEVALDSRVLAFTILASIVAAILSGLAPAWQAGGLSPNAVMKDGGATERRGRSRGFLVKGLLVVQVALSAVLLVSTGQLVRSFRNLTNLPTGFSVPNQVVLRVDVTGSAVPQTNIHPLYEQVRERLATVPGIRSVGISDTGFFSGSHTLLEIASGDGTRQDKQVVRMRIGPGYLSTLGLDVVAGRDVSAEDTPTAAPVVLVNETLAKRLFGNSDPIGAEVAVENRRLQVVGVVRDARYRNLRSDAPSIIFAPVWQSPTPPMTMIFTLRADAPMSARLTEHLKGQVHDASPRLIVAEMNTMTTLIERTLTRDRLIATLSTAFSLLAIILAACGLYALMSAVVARQTRELGIRAALGADPLKLARGVVGEALRLVGIGVVLGLIGAAAAAGLITHFLFGIDPRDSLAYGFTAVLLFVVGGLAAYLPARKAASADPLLAIRAE